MPDPEIIKQNVGHVRDQLAAGGAGDASPVIIAVTKTFPPAAVRAVAAAGISDIGENYLQEAEAKISACADLPLTWHFIGALQKNKTARIARLFDWVHSVDRLSFAERLAAARPADKPLNVLMQVNISAEAGKSGVAVTEAASLAQRIAALPAIRLRGLMILPLWTTDSGQQYEIFSRTARLQQDLIARCGIALDCLSMGMSGDYQQAVRAGATHIRLGTALFGARVKKGEQP